MLCILLIYMHLFPKAAVWIIGPTMQAVVIGTKMDTSILLPRWASGKRKFAPARAPVAVVDHSGLEYIRKVPEVIAVRQMCETQISLAQEPGRKVLVVENESRLT